MVPLPVLRGLLRVALGDRSVALCLHRVAERPRPEDRLPDMTISPSRLDALLGLLLSARAPSERWLTVCFDDGYLDSAEYIASRAPRFPFVEWLFFVCPEKVERQAGFRWDLVDRSTRPDEVERVLFSEVDLRGENERADLRASASRAGFRLADVATCRALARLPNVTLGNHTNVHHKPVLLRPDQVAPELKESTRDFTRLFGPPAHFAIPFGTPAIEFDARYVVALRAIGDFVIWTTEARPFEASERRPGAVLPRFPIDGTRSARQTALLIALYAARYRAFGTPHRFDEADAARRAMGTAA